MSTEGKVEKILWALKVPEALLALFLIPGFILFGVRVIDYLNNFKNTWRLP